MSFEELRSEVHKTYMEYYVAGFKSNDVTLIDKMVKYPIAYNKNGSVTMCDSYPIDPKSLKKKGLGSFCRLEIRGDSCQ